MTAQPAPARRMSKSSLLSLICGLLGCVPFVAGGLAVLLGIVGIVRTGNPEKKGRWMAVVGMLLGIASLGMWTLGGGAFVWALVAGTSAPRVATHDYIQAAGEKNRAAEKSLTQGFSDEDLDKIEAQVQKHGKFIDTTFSNVNVNNNTAEVSGTAKFDSGTYEIEASLEKSDNWKVTRMYLHVEPR